MGKFFTHVPLTLWPKVSVVVFLGLFCAICIWTLFIAPSARYRHGAGLPLDEDDQ